MKRLIDWHLKQWKDDPRRKPLVLRGARQVGKTYAVRELGNHFESMIEINFEQLPDAKVIFEQNLIPERIIRELNYLTKKVITPGKTLLFFDEVQSAPQVILALRYFYEEMPGLHVIAAGSLLDFAIEKIGMPVGRVSMLYVYPLSFLEFLGATGNSIFINAILQCEKYSEIIHNELIDLVKQYLAIGGMPEVVATWIDTKNPIICNEIQKQLIETYRADFPKYSKKHQIKYVELLFNQIPKLIRNSFKYSQIHGEFKKRELAPCLDLLRHANVVHQVTHSSGNGIPLGASVNLEKFKLIFIDTGITQAFLGLDITSWFLSNNDSFVNQGAIIEAFVGQEILSYSSPKWKNELYFWKRDSNGSLSEVDYLYEYKGMVLPIEVKSGHGSTLRSLHQFLLEHPKSEYGIRFYSEQHSMINNIDSRPLYAVATIAHPDQKDAINSLLS